MLRALCSLCMHGFSFRTNFLIFKYQIIRKTFLFIVMKEHDVCLNIKCGTCCPTKTFISNSNHNISHSMVLHGLHASVSRVQEDFSVNELHVCVVTVQVIALSCWSLCNEKSIPSSLIHSQTSSSLPSLFWLTDISNPAAWSLCLQIWWSNNPVMM